MTLSVCLLPHARTIEPWNGASKNIWLGNFAKFSDKFQFSLRVNNNCRWRTASSGMLRCVALVKTDVSEELSASIIRVTRIGELSVTSNRRTLVTLMMEALSSSETSALRRATWRNIPEDAIRHSNRRKNLKSYNNCGCFLRKPYLISEQFEFKSQNIYWRIDIKNIVKKNKGHILYSF
jgi:hypothetical protein